MVLVLYDTMSVALWHVELDLCSNDDVFVVIVAFFCVSAHGNRCCRPT